MEFVPATGVDARDLDTLADRLAGTYDNLQDHVTALGLETDSVSTLEMDLLEGKFLSQCTECDLWEKPGDLIHGLCYACDEDEDDFDDWDDEDDFGFDDDDLDDEDEVWDEDDDFGDYWFDETDDEE